MNSTLFLFPRSASQKRLCQLVSFLLQKCTCNLLVLKPIANGNTKQKAIKPTFSNFSTDVIFIGRIPAYFFTGTACSNSTQLQQSVTHVRVVECLLSLFDSAALSVGCFTDPGGVAAEYHVNCTNGKGPAQSAVLTKHKPPHRTSCYTRHHVGPAVQSVGKAFEPRYWPCTECAEGAQTPCAGWGGGEHI